jgi:O-acetyl-ADP-ribose deacetylase (regulator of RNase III)
MNYLYYIHADVTNTQSNGHQVIAHVCTGSGVWLDEKAKAIARKWPQTKDAYRQWYRRRISNDFTLGSVQFVNAQPAQADRMVRVANMLAQPDIRRPVQYRALRRCLTAVGRKAIQIGASVHMPKLSEEQTGSWRDIELIICNILCAASIPVYIYDLPARQEPIWLNTVLDQSRRPYHPTIYRVGC